MAGASRLHYEPEGAASISMSMLAQSAPPTLEKSSPGWSGPKRSQMVLPLGVARYSSVIPISAAPEIIQPGWKAGPHQPARREVSRVDASTWNGQVDYIAAARAGTTAILAGQSHAAALDMWPASGFAVAADTNGRTETRHAPLISRGSHERR